jgi:hypothetical protein
MRDRAKDFQDATIPEVIQITYPGFTTASRKRDPAQVLNTVATPKRGTPLRLELNEEIYDWLVLAATNCDYKHTSPKTRAQKAVALVDDRPTIDEPNVMWWFRSVGHLLTLCVWWYDGEKIDWNTKIATASTEADVYRIAVYLQICLKTTTSLTGKTMINMRKQSIRCLRMRLNLRAHPQQVNQRRLRNVLIGDKALGAASYTSHAVGIEASKRSSEDAGPTETSCGLYGADAAN